MVLPPTFFIVQEKRLETSMLLTVISLKMESELPLPAFSEGKLKCGGKLRVWCVFAFCSACKCAYVAFSPFPRMKDREKGRSNKPTETGEGCKQIAATTTKSKAFPSRFIGEHRRTKVDPYGKIRSILKGSTHKEYEPR